MSLGCPKNLVDSEVMMGLLAQGGAQITARAEDADIIVVNTCSFIDTAKQESVDTILEMAQHKISGRAQKLIVAGCLVERYRNEIQKNIPEVDAVVGTGELEQILSAAGIAPAAAATDSPFVILNDRPKARPVRLPAGLRKKRGTARSPTCRTTSTTTPRRAYWRRRNTPRTSRLPKAAIIPAVSASFPSCAASFVRGVLNR